MGNGINFYFSFDCVCVSHSVMSDSLGRMDCSSPGSYVLWNSPGKMLEWVAIPFSKGSSWPRDQTPVSCIAGRLFILNHQGITVFCLSIKNVNTTKCLFHLKIANSLTLILALLIVLWFLDLCEWEHVPQLKVRQSIWFAHNPGNQFM